ncbi:MAG: branched-chain amino acid ABC transporter permease [Rhodospirillaceae bacterium]|nr:branched-chain amino acid ABC transporter permease [Rhodospirillaceae bacterium]
MNLLLQTIANGVLIGGIYAALAIGFQLAFGVLDVVDFAVGGWAMLGGYAGYWASVLLGLDFIPTLPATFLLFAIIGFLVGPLIYRVRTSRYARPALMALAFTFGLATLMRGGVLTLWGFDTRSVSTALGGMSATLGPMTLPLLRLVAFGLAVAAGVGLFVFLYGTRLGLAIRATAENRDYAAMAGVDVRRVSAIVYAIYTGLTATVGVLLAAIYSVTPEVGIRYTLLAFFVVVMAGLGSVGGVLVAGLVLGLLEALVTVYVSASYAFLAVFGVLYLVLLVAPAGVLRRAG